MQWWNRPVRIDSVDVGDAVRIPNQLEGDPSSRRRWRLEATPKRAPNEDRNQPAILRHCFRRCSRSRCFSCFSREESRKCHQGAQHSDNRDRTCPGKQLSPPTTSVISGISTCAGAVQLGSVIG